LIALCKYPSVEELVRTGLRELMRSLVRTVSNLPIVCLSRSPASSKVGQQPPRPMERKDLWKSLWRLKVVPKVHVFWCQVMRGIMPDYSTLTRRRVRDNSTCSICKSSPETLLHALAECPHACMFWSEAREILNVKLTRLHPDTWAIDVLCES
jgi:hypothetical protein